MADENDAGKGKRSVLTIQDPPESSKDPIGRMIEILKDTELGDDDKIVLINFSQNRFKNRRRMAYIALSAICTLLGFVLIAALIVGLVEQSSILTQLQAVQWLLSALVAFLTGIIGAYYGAAALRPSS